MSNLGYWKQKELRKAMANKHTNEMDKKYPHDIAYSVSKTKIYNEYILPKESIESKVDTTIIEVCGQDSVSAIFDNYVENEVMAVLNFASFKNAGGGFMAGSSAQEESLCHESFLYNVLRAFPKYYEKNQTMLNRALYENRALYSPMVCFERGKDSCVCDVITCAAPNISPSRKYGWGITAEENSKALRSRIDFVLSIAADNKVETLILGAFGCGVFGQDAKEVATIFKEFLETKYANVFKKVVFAVPSNMHTHNYDAFVEVF